jgi:hypothetical protein
VIGMNSTAPAQTRIRQHLDGSRTGRRYRG